MLKLRHKDNNQNAVWLVEPKLTLGSAADNDLVLAGQGVAPKHAEILIEHECLTLRSLSKTCTVRVNGKDLEQDITLKARDVLSLGSVELEIIDPKYGKKSAESAAVAKTPEVKSPWSLKSNHSALQNRVFNLGTNTIVGRSNECDITLAAAHLSRRHAQLIVENERLLVKDLDSSNGTFLNGKRVKEAWVTRGDELRFDTLAFGVMGPADDLDKTTIRQSATAPPKAQVHKPKPAVRVNRQNTPQALPSKGDTQTRPEVIVTGPSSTSASKWALGLGFVALVALAAYVYSQGL
jgi:pSer/pThr/pTyr-binding forkhead associated (FHA) protein